MTTAVHHPLTPKLAIQSVLFFGLLASSFGLAYLLIAGPSAPPQGPSSSPAPSIVAPAGPAPLQAQGALSAKPPTAAPPLAMVEAPSLASHGACAEIDNFSSPSQEAAAKSMLAAGPLRTKSWAVATPFLAQYAAGVRTADAQQARRVAAALSAKGHEPLSTSPTFVALAAADTAEEAIALATSAGLAGVEVTARLVSPAGERNSIVLLAQTPSEIAFASSLAKRLPGARFSHAPCPAAAAPLLAAP